MIGGVDDAEPLLSCDELDYGIGTYELYNDQVYLPIFTIHRSKMHTDARFFFVSKTILFVPSVSFKILIIWIEIIS